MSSKPQSVKTKGTPTPSGVFEEGDKKGIPQNVTTRVNTLELLYQLENAKLTWAIVRARNNVVISLRKKGNLVTVNVVTLAGGRVISGFNVRLLDRVIKALIDLSNELEAKGLKPKQESESKKTSVREY